MAAARSQLRPFLQVAAFAAVAFTARASFADHYKVPSSSMSPTVHVGDHIIVAKAAYGLRVPMTDAWLVRYGTPSRGEVVVLDPPERNPSEVPASVLLKRVVAVSGEVVEVKDGRVRIDGKEVREPWASLDEGSGPDFGPVRIPEGKLLVLGDNRGNSRDGRTFGFVDRARVLGRAFAVVARDGAFTYAPL